MTTVTFDNETISDAIEKGNRIAPRMMGTTTHVAGIQITIDPSQDDPVMIRATNGDTYWSCWVDTVEVTGEPAVWRILGERVNSITRDLPMGDKRRVTFSDEAVPGRISVKGPRLNAWMAQLSTDAFPLWEPFDEERTYPVAALAEKVEAVAWAASKDLTLLPWCGVMFDGKRVVASDRFKMALMPCELPLEEPIVLSVDKTLPLIKHAGDVRLGMIGGILGICPDGYSQIATSVYGTKYPAIDAMVRSDYAHYVELVRAEIAPYAKRADAYVQKQSAIGVELVIGDGQMAFLVHDMEGTEGTEEYVELPNQAKHSPVRMTLSARHLADALSNGHGDVIRLHYDDDGMFLRERKPVLYIEGTDGYQCWLSKLQPKAAQ